MTDRQEMEDTMRALVIDDSKAMRMLLKRELVALGFEVFEAGDGQEAISRLAELGPVDVVLVDWTMPGMDGMTFVHQVRAEAAYEEMRVVMITSDRSQPLRSVSTMRPLLSPTVLMK